MKIEKTVSEIKYKREIEGMGTGLVLFKISATNKHIGANYHLYYENGWKPPLDIAINIEKSLIEYVSFFAQDEKIIEKKNGVKITLMKESIRIKDSDFSEKKYEKSIQKEFEILKINNDIVLLSKKLHDGILGYQLDDNNYVLCNQKNDIVGILLKRFSHTEFKVLKESLVI